MSKEASETRIVDALSLLARWSEMFDADIADIMADNGALKPIANWPKVWRQMLCGIDVKEIFERSKDGADSSWDKVGEILKLKWISAKDLGELLARHKSVDAFVSPKIEAHAHLHLHAEVNAKLQGALAREQRLIEMQAADVAVEPVNEPGKDAK